jgi:hypothetical protein
MRTTYIIPANDLLFSVSLGEERRLLADLLNKHGPLNIIQQLGEVGATEQLPRCRQLINGDIALMDC